MAADVKSPGEVGGVIALDHAGITTSDIDLLVGIFRDALGLPVTEPKLYADVALARMTGVSGAAARIAYVQLGRQRIELLEYVSPPPRGPAALRPCDPGTVHVALQVTGISDVARALCAAGFRRAGEIQLTDPPISFYTIYLQGLDGIYIELIEYVPPTTDAGRPSTTTDAKQQ